ncbi:MAG TPA: low molecular weight phosphatase family protein [Rhizomicrobium sp.]|nr:low molecular weight phosphatase family protein [Rhizomicrobium sp.]
MERVLCVCLGNRSRSPMMQAVLQELLGPDFQVESAGAGREAAGFARANARSIACMKERGIDLSGHASRWAGDLDLTQYGWIVCVGRDEADKVRAWLGSNASTVVIVANERQGGIPDPYEFGLPAYRDCLALLDAVMPAIARQIDGGRL